MYVQTYKGQSIVPLRQVNRWILNKNKTGPILETALLCKDISHWLGASLESHLLNDNETNKSQYQINTERMVVVVVVVVVCVWSGRVWGGGNDNETWYIGKRINDT